MAQVQGAVSLSPLLLPPTASTAATRARQSSTNLPSSRARANSGAAARAADSDSSLKLDSNGAGRWAGQQRRSVSTTTRPVSASRPGQGLISTLQPSPSSPKQAIAPPQVGQPPRRPGRGRGAP